MKTDHNSWTDALAALRETLPEGNGAAEAAPDGIASPASKSPRITVTISYERKGRGGKAATIVAGLDALDDDALLALASELKKTLAAGGSARGGEILLQGDVRQRLRPLLRGRGFIVKG